MNLENTKAQMRKGVLEFCILSILSEEEAYVSDIINKMKEAKLIVVEGTLYPLLNRLKNDGVLEYRWEESKSGPPRKYYKITPLGKAMLDELMVSWNELIASVNSIITI
ncbi:MAG: PadR family transcriptional regulator [Bacteroidetes bacterium CG2_30_32_10]|nr:MAG: PadR family transcriptional regulator [Bacteroidetes bacterium CG2_30_32_10]